uniref:Syntaxin-7 n=1 Tax=Bos mutus grunniens TaxID=30521 RepID=A0A8B9YAK8_BOSMU
MSYTPGVGGDPAQLAQRISSNIQKITQCSAEIQRTLNQLGTPQDSPELRQQLQQKQQYTNQLAKETDKYIKEFGSLPTTPSDQRQRKIQKDRLVAEFTASLTNFQKVQRQAAEREKEFVARVRASSRVSGGFPEESSKERNLVSWESQTQPQAQLQDEEITEDDLRLIQERESSIRQLEADIMDINEIFKDLGMMIHEQGDVIVGSSWSQNHRVCNRQSTTLGIIENRSHFWLLLVEMTDFMYLRSPKFNQVLLLLTSWKVPCNIILAHSQDLWFLSYPILILITPRLWGKCLFIMCTLSSLLK